jgi:hypothetical protein
MLWVRSLVCFAGLLTQFQGYLGRTPSLPKFDNAMLFSGASFKDGIVGLAGVSTMCGGPVSCAVCQLNRGADPLDALVCAHEMYVHRLPFRSRLLSYFDANSKRVSFRGHNLGMEHDSYGNQCANRGYIMAPYEGSVRFNYHCLRRNH